MLIWGVLFNNTINHNINTLL